MRRIHKAIAARARFSMDERGATAVEYALIVGLLAGGILVLVTTIGQEITAILNELRDALRV